MILRFTPALLAALAVAATPEPSDPAEGAAPPSGPAAVDRAREERTSPLEGDAAADGTSGDAGARGGGAGSRAGAGAPDVSAALAHDGTYRVHGTARISARPLPMDAAEVHADVVVRAGPEPGLLALRVASQGQTCLLAAHLGEGGALSISAGQRCQVRLAPPEGRGEVTGVLREGRGRLAGERLALDLAFEVEGTVSLPLPKELAMLGGASEAWTPDLPVRGEARAAAEGKRDASRAAEDAAAGR